MPTYKRINLFYLPLHTHDEDHFDRPQILKLASGTHTESILNRNKKHNEGYQKIAKKTFTKTECSITYKFTIHTSYKPKNWNICPNSSTQKHSFTILHKKTCSSRTNAVILLYRTQSCPRPD